MVVINDYNFLIGCEFWEIQLSIFAKFLEDQKLVTMWSIKQTLKEFYKEFKLQTVQWHIQNQIYPKGLPLCTAANRDPSQLNVNHHNATIQLNVALPPNQKIN